MNKPTVVTPIAWLESRQQLLAREKSALQELDAVAQQRRELPWVRVEKPYEFETEKGTRTLADLFVDHSQLMVYHFMFGPDWEEGCHACSFVCDHFDGANLHLSNHDVSLVVVSRAKLLTLTPFKQRMGWNFPWVSSHDCDFNYDFGVSFKPEELSTGSAIYNYVDTERVMDEMQGLSVFFKDETGAIFHTYSTYARGLDLLIGAHNLLDLTPKGRNEQGTMNWVRHHDKYENSNALDACSKDTPVSEETCCDKKETV